MGTHILIPTDGSEHAERAFEHALEMAERADADIHLLHVVDTNRYGEPALSSAELLVTRQEDAGTQMLKHLAGRARERSIPATLGQCHGNPADRILACIESEGVDTVVMGRQGFDHRYSMGSVAAEVLERSDAEVVLV